MEKVRKAFYIDEELLEQVDVLLGQADVRSRNEFVLHWISYFRENRELYAGDHLLRHACNRERQ